MCDDAGQKKKEDEDMQVLKRKAATLIVSAAAFMMIFTGTVSADEIPQAGQNVQVEAQMDSEEMGPGVGKWFEELNRKAEQKAAERAAAKEKQEIGPWMMLSQNEDQAAGTSPDGKEQEIGPGGAPTENTRVIDPAKPMVALTIDDGPYAPVGNRILDCLAEHGAKATFYMVGNRCSSYVEEMQRIAADGHELGNHTYSHKYLNKLGAEGIRSEIDRGAEAIQSTAGVAPATVRLPGGLKNDTVLANVNAPMIMWSIDTLDWKTRDAQSTVDAVLGRVKDGDIILVHELYQPTADAVIQLVPALIERGYQLVTVSEMATHRGGLENGKLYYHFYPEQ